MSITVPGVLRSAIESKEHVCERESSPLRRHRRAQEQCDGVRAGAHWATAHGSEEAEVPDLYARPQAVARLVEELPGDGDRDGVDGPVLAAAVELAGGRVRQAGSGESATHQGAQWLSDRPQGCAVDRRPAGARQTER